MKRETKVSRGAAALPAERRVLARPGWVGEKSEHFEHPEGLLFCGDAMVFPQPADRMGHR